MASQPRATCSLSGSSTCSPSRRSHRRSLRRTVRTRKIARWNMRRPCADCSQCSAYVAPASSSGAVTTASAMEIVRIKMEKSSSTPCSLQPVRMVFCLSLQAVHKRRYKSLTRPPWPFRSLCHQCRRHDGSTPRNRGEPLRGRLLEHFSAPKIPEESCARLPPEPRPQVCGLLQVRFLL